MNSSQLASAVNGAWGGMRVAFQEVAKADCPRASVGCVILNSDGEITGAAHNARALAFGPCNCSGGVDTLQGSSPTCKTAHAEMLALLRASGHGDMRVLVCTRAPCHQCLNIISHTAIDTIVAHIEWPDRDGSQERWDAQGKRWIRCDVKPS